MEASGTFSLRLDMNGNHSNRVSMINEDKSLEPKKSTTRDTGLGCDANVSYQPTWGGIDFSTSWNYQYSLNSINDNDTYTRNYSFRLEGYVDLPFGLQLRTDGAYSFRNGTNIRKGEDDQMLWNASASWRFLKRKKRNCLLIGRIFSERGKVSAVRLLLMVFMSSVTRK